MAHQDHDEPRRSRCRRRDVASTITISEILESPAIVRHRHVALKDATELHFMINDSGFTVVVEDALSWANYHGLHDDIKDVGGDGAVHGDVDSGVLLRPDPSSVERRRRLERDEDGSLLGVVRTLHVKDGRHVCLEVWDAESSGAAPTTTRVRRRWRESTNSILHGQRDRQGRRDA
ncbi:hypothetical protein OsJ_14481 [Oryza sativa Japonica Group]|uniref:Uncharacterized protein n=1 Tax=Oryza sativa subsp. japonica TaxID=39947 RepID=A3ASZ1_ORYSJ|nr:hypothetical protein OsJ_14481 [Oryza sativa Japonica Group]